MNSAEGGKISPVQEYDRKYGLDFPKVGSTSGRIGLKLAKTTPIHDQ